MRHVLNVLTIALVWLIASIVLHYMSDIPARVFFWAGLLWFNVQYFIDELKIKSKVL